MRADAPTDNALNDRLVREVLFLDPSQDRPVLEDVVRRRHERQIAVRRNNEGVAVAATR